MFFTWIFTQTNTPHFQCYTWVQVISVFLTSETPTQEECTNHFAEYTNILNAQGQNFVMYKNFKHCVYVLKASLFFLKN